MTKITIPGIPIGKARPRVTLHGAYTPKKTKDYEFFIRQCWMAQKGKRIEDGKSVAIELTAYFPVPKSCSGKAKAEMPGTPYTKKPDIDNVLKVVMDALNGLAFKDDSAVSEIRAKKFYGEPKLEITLEEL